MLFRARIHDGRDDFLSAQSLQIFHSHRAFVGAVLSSDARIARPLGTLDDVASETAVLHHIDSVAAVRRQVCAQRLGAGSDARSAPADGGGFSEAGCSATGVRRINFDWVSLLTYADGADWLVTRTYGLFPAGSGDRREPFSAGHEVGASVPQALAGLSGLTTGARSASDVGRLAKYHRVDELPNLPLRCGR